MRAMADMFPPGEIPGGSLTVSRHPVIPGRIPKVFFIGSCEVFGIGISHHFTDLINFIFDAVEQLVGLLENHLYGPVVLATGI